MGTPGALHDLIGRLPGRVSLDIRGDGPEVVYTYEGESPDDRPEVGTLVDERARFQETFVFDCSLVNC